jgi:hypothetical protein
MTAGNFINKVAFEFAKEKPFLKHDFEAQGQIKQYD